MNKILEALEPSVILKFVDGLLKRYEGKSDYNIYITKDWLLDIKQALQRLEDIDNAKSSEALDSLEYLHNSKLFEYDDDEDYYTDQYYIVENYVLKAQEQENVLNELLMLVNDLEPTFNRKGVSNDIAILGTIFKDYFYDNASDLLKRYFDER